MGYQTVKKLPNLVRSYARAKLVHDNAVPIRGRDPEVRPLGDRRDCDTYRVRMNGDVVEFVLYKTPVIEYHPNGEIRIRTAGWSTVSTHQTISWVLGIEVNGVRGKSVVTDSTGAKYVMDAETMLTLQQDDYKMVVKNAPALFGYHINRKAMNNVRARYSEFADYIKTFVSLRQQETVNKSYYGKEFTTREIAFTVGEAAQLLGTGWMNGMDNGRLIVNTQQWRPLDQFPVRSWAESGKMKDKFDACARDLLRLCANDQPEAGKHQNFYKAVMALMTHDMMYMDAEEGDLTNIRWFRCGGSSSLEGMFADILRKVHRHEVLEKVELKSGQTPNPQYMVWMED